MRRGLLLLAMLATACRDGAPPFSIEEPGASESGQLTFNLRQDRAPAFSVHPDSVYYVAESYPNLPVSNGLLLGLPRTGGRVRLLLPSVQLGGTAQPWLTAPAFSNDGRSIAFFELTDTGVSHCDFVRCPFPITAPVDTTGTNSQLVQGVLRVRQVSSTASQDAGRLTVQFAGRPVNWRNLTLIPNVAYPFQRSFERDGVHIFRPSWSPDGTRIVFSDGLSLRVWTVGQSTTVLLPGTDDGVLPAWSPDGNWIAFTRLLRGTEQHIVCSCNVFGAALPRANFDRTIYTGSNRENGELMLIRPDGSGRRSLGLGEAPAWLPDSKTIVVHRDFRLVKVSADSGAGTAITGTDDAYEPAVSRDGRWLAYVKVLEVPNVVGGSHNIWITQLQ